MTGEVVCFAIGFILTIMLFVFAVGSSILVYEQKEQRRKNRKKKSERRKAGK